jgi:HSP20 family protein
MTMQNIGENPWPMRVLSEGWHTLRNKAQQALTYFSPKDEAEHAVTQRWGLVAADVVDHADHVEVRIEVPGMEKADLSVDAVGRHLVVSGEKRSEETRKEGRVVVTERAFGQFRRVVPLPADVDVAAAKANYTDGVLAIDLPKAVTRKQHHISIDRG